MKYLKLKNKIKTLESEKFDLFWHKTKLEKENEELCEKIKYLGEQIKSSQAPVTNLNIDISVDEAVKMIAEKINGSKEHKCTKECFVEHVLKPIQKDYDKIGIKDWKAKAQLIEYWAEKINKEYDFIEYFYMVKGKIYVTFK